MVNNFWSPSCLQRLIVKSSKKISTFLVFWCFGVFSQMHLCFFHNLEFLAKWCTFLEMTCTRITIFPRAPKIYYRLYPQCRSFFFQLKLTFKGRQKLKNNHFSVQNWKITLTLFFVLLLFPEFSIHLMQLFSCQMALCLQCDTNKLQIVQTLLW